MFTTPKVTVSAVLAPEALEYTESMLESLRKEWWQNAQKNCTKASEVPLQVEDLQASLLDTLVTFARVSRPQLMRQWEERGGHFREVAMQAVGDPLLRPLGEAMLWDKCGQPPISGVSASKLAYEVADIIGSVGSHRRQLSEVEVALYRDILSIWDYWTWITNHTEYNTQLGGQFLCMA